MTITIRQKALANDNISLYLDIYDGGKRKFEFLSLYLLPEVDAETKARNEETLQRAHQIRAERILHPETIPEVGHLMIVKEIPNDESPEVLDWIQTYIDWMSDNTDYSKAIVDQSKYLKYLMSEFLANKRRPHITLRKFDKEWFKAFFLWLKNDYVPQKYVRVEAKPLCEGSLHNVQQRIVAVFNKAVKFGKLKANPFYQLEKSDIYTLFNVDDANIKKGDVNIFKLLTSMSNTDPNLMIEVLAGNDIGWGDFLKRTLIEMFMDTLLFSLIGGPVGLALFVLKEWWALNKGRNHMASDLARKSKDGLISDLRKKIEERSELMYSKINKEYDLEFNRISKDVRAKISEERKLLEDMKNKLSNAQFDYASEIDRCEYITNKIWDIAHTSYVSVFERELTKETFELLSVH